MELIWDFDGTLFDTYPLMADSLRRAMLEEGHDVPVQDIRARMAVTLSDAVAHYKRTLGITEDTMERYRHVMYAQGWRAARPFAGAEDVCARVCREGGHNHLCTHRGVTARKYMEAWGLDRYFSVYVTDEDGLPRKPAPDMVRRVLEAKQGLIEAALSDAFGAPMRLRMVNEGQTAAAKPTADARRVIEQSYDIFGRDKIDLTD